MRISGLASGFDTDEMVKQLMQIERMKVDRVEQQKQTIQWRQEEYNSVNKKFANFILNTQKDMGLKKTSMTGALFGNSYKNVDYVKKAESSDESIATATATTKDVNGNYSFEVTNLAEDARFVSGKITDETLEGAKYISFKINDETITVGDGTKTLTMDDVSKAINSTEGLSSFYDKSNGRLFVQDTDGGKEIKFTPTTNSKGINLVDKLNLEKYARDENGKVIEDQIINENGSIFTEKQNAKIIYNGVELEYDSNNIELNGLNIELKAKGTTTINVSTNVEGMIEKVEKFVEDYNKLVDEISGLTSEKVNRDYNPLSPEERKALSEEDLKLWDEKAKSGLLNRDETLTRTLQSMRSNIYKTLEGDGSFNHITQIGISTEKYSMGSAGGKLQIDLDKLRDAIVKDADGVMDLLFKEGEYDSKGNEILESTNKYTGTSTKGVFNRIYDDLIDGMKGIIDKSGPGNDENLYRSIKSNILIDFRTKKGSISDLDRSMTQMDREIANLNILLGKKEDAHYAKFTAMEKAMHRMNGQSDWLYQQMQF